MVQSARHISTYCSSNCSIMWNFSNPKFILLYEIFLWKKLCNVIRSCIRRCINFQNKRVTLNNKKIYSNLEQETVFRLSLDKHKMLLNTFLILCCGAALINGIFTDYSTQPTSAGIIPCEKAGDIFTQFFCSLPINANKIKQHPIFQHWYIRCDQAGSICMPCPNNLHYSERCDACYGEVNYLGSCPSPQPKASNPCDIPTNVCPAGSCTNYEIISNPNTNEAYCQCINNGNICRSCAHGSHYDVASKCCI